jgi:hypothetical protein
MKNYLTFIFFCSLNKNPFLQQTLGLTPWPTIMQESLCLSRLSLCSTASWRLGGITRQQCGGMSQ